MIKAFVKAWEERKLQLEAHLTTIDVDKLEYKNLVELVIEKVINSYYANNSDYELSLDKLTEIDNGDYQGTLLYVVARKTYQPDTEDYFYTSVGYGSCSGCDTLQSIQSGYSGDDDLHTPTCEQVKELMILCLHLIQRFKYLDYRQEEINNDKKDD